VIEPEVGINVVDLGLIQEKARSVTEGEAVEVVLVDKAWSWNEAAPTDVCYPRLL
jgi:metal-sulfur cluster biosynthetic enzyme